MLDGSTKNNFLLKRVIEKFRERMEILHLILPKVGNC